MIIRMYLSPFAGGPCAEGFVLGRRWCLGLIEGGPEACSSEGESTFALAPRTSWHQQAVEEYLTCKVRGGEPLFFFFLKKAFEKC